MLDSHAGETIANQVRNFIQTNFLFQSGSLAEDCSLIDAGIIDSTGVVELVAFLEERFGILVADEELVPENLDTLARIAAYVERKQGK